MVKDAYLLIGKNMYLNLEETPNTKHQITNKFQ